MKRSLFCLTALGAAALASAPRSVLARETIRVARVTSSRSRAGNSVAGCGATSRPKRWRSYTAADFRD